MTLKENAITVAIAVLFTTLVLVSIDAFYPRPEYSQFCKSSSIVKPVPMKQINCSYSQSPAEQICWQDGGMAEYNYTDDGCTVYLSCSYCSKDFTEAEKRYTNNIFLIIAPLGAIAIILGVFYTIEFLGSGFMFAGIILMFYGTVQNFSELNKFIKVVVVFLELILVIFIAYKKIIPPKSIKS